MPGANEQVDRADVDALRSKEPAQRAEDAMLRSTEPVQRLDIRFRASAAPQRSAFPGGWVVWLLAGAAIGLGLWTSGRQLLVRRLARQLAEAERPADA